MELSSISSQVSSQAAAQFSAQMSLLLLKKTLELQTANISGLMQPVAPVSAPSNPPNLGTSIDVMA
ncbi:putative motility protein [Phytopseudomonas punonensis]|uniref:Putative motility protein n=1 Tax=Phytopseudomonas punonensis TaxID=1220495 RepID=A0A1M7HUU4_9GAMM|nr:putative motility protein [Pseudomonas punonensis]SHM32245.1 Putative motility protein [Pseudomonas punonensis]